MNRFTNVLVALTLTAGLTACGGGYSGFIIPIETDLKPWVVPEADEILEANGGEDDEVADEGDYEDYEGDDDDDDEVTPAPAPKPAAAPAPTKTPTKK